MLDRRQVLAGAVAAGCTALTPRLLAAESRHSREAASARLIGAWYLEYCPGERNRAALMACLSAAIPGFASDAAGLSSPAVRAKISQACSDDFRRDDVIAVGGWLFARTELRLCALAVAA